MGVLQFILSFQMTVLLLVPVLPLFIDLFFILMQRVTPAVLFEVVGAKVDKLRGKVGSAVEIKDFKILCIDKSFNVATVRVEVSEQT